MDVPTDRTFAHDDLLPRVPLPTLEDSCERFLSWCAPLLTGPELDRTADAVAAFLQPDGPGRRLQRALERYDAEPGVHSWLDEFWPSRYLGRRDRIALNANFFFLLREAGPEQVERAAALVAAAVAYKLRLDAERVPPAVSQGRVLSMDQNRQLFSATRIPGPVQDTVRTPWSDDWPGPSTARHVLVLAGGRAFRLDVLGPGGRPHALEEIEAGLRAVLAAGTAAGDDGLFVGPLTTLARAEWAASRQALLDASPDNAASLDVVETALFCVCLDDVVPGDVRAAGDHLLHGDSRNRWFDKALSFIVFGDGTAGLNVEHSHLDGTTVLGVVDALLGEPAREQSLRSGARPQGVPPFAPVDFVLDAELESRVRAAEESFLAYAAATVTTVVHFDDLGADRIKGLRTSPDAFAQLAYQLAHHRTRGAVGATYESIATRHFRRGRTEAMRVVTPEVLRFVAALDDPGAPPEARRSAYRAAAAAHVARAKQCQAGAAPEQHLWELQLLQQRRGVDLGVHEVPDLYASPGWLTMRDDHLSTSSAPSVNISYFGFGSTSARCIGIAYVLLPDRWNLYLSAPRRIADELTAFADELRQAVAELAGLLEGEPAQP